MIGRPQRAIAVLAALVLVASLAASQPPCEATSRVQDRWSEYQARLDELAADQRETLAHLFELSRRVEEHRAQAAELGVTAARLAEDESRLALEADEALLARDQARVAAKSAIRIVQRLGPASYLDLLLGASNLKDLLNRLSLALSVARGTSAAARRVAQRHQALSLAVMELAAQRQRVAAARDEQLQAAEQLAHSRDQLEASLTGLGDERSLYEERLEELERAWAEQTAPVVARLVAGFYRLLDEGPDLPGSRLLLTAGGFQLLVPIAALNEVMARTPDLSGALFVVSDDGLRLDVPAAALSVEVQLGVRPPTTLVFAVDRVRFLGFDIDDRSVSLMFPERELAADLGPVLSGFGLREVGMRDEDIALSLRAGR